MKKNMKRFIAIIGLVILGALYAATLISAIFTTPEAPQMFKACLYATIVVPVLLYGYLLIYKVMKQRSEDAGRDFNDAIRKMSRENTNVHPENGTATDDDAEKPNTPQ